MLGNLTAARLTTVVLSALSEEYEFSNYFCSTDSQVALAWIKAVEKEFKVFVQNRAEEIRKKVKPEVWHYCKSEDNPADIITRESSPLKLSDNKLW